MQEDCPARPPPRPPAPVFELGEARCVSPSPLGTEDLNAGLVCGKNDGAAALMGQQVAVTAARSLWAGGSCGFFPGKVTPLDFLEPEGEGNGVLQGGKS